MLWFGNILERSRMFRDASGFENGSRKWPEPKMLKWALILLRKSCWVQWRCPLVDPGVRTFEGAWYGLDYRPIGPKIGFSRKCSIFGVRPEYFGGFYDVTSEFNFGTSRVGNNASRSILGLMGLKSVLGPISDILREAWKCYFVLIFGVGFCIWNLEHVDLCQDGPEIGRWANWPCMSDHYWNSF